MDSSPMTVGAFRRGRPPSRWPRRTQGERTPSSFCGTPTASAAAMPRVRRLRPMARHDGVMRRWRKGRRRNQERTTEKGKRSRKRDQEENEDRRKRGKRKKRRRKTERRGKRKPRRERRSSKKTENEKRTEKHPRRRMKRTKETIGNGSQIKNEKEPIDGTASRGAQAKTTNQANQKQNNTKMPTRGRKKNPAAPRAFRGLPAKWILRRRYVRIAPSHARTTPALHLRRARRLLDP